MGIVIGVFDKGLNDLRELVALAGVKFAVFNFVETLKHFAFFVRSLTKVARAAVMVPMGDDKVA